MDVLHLIARNSVEWMFYCLLEGTALAVFAWIVLRLLPRQNSGTRFALWFSVLLATILLPFLAGTFFRAPYLKTTSASTAIASAHSLLIFPESLAFGIFAIWAVIAATALTRVMAGLWQVNRIRRNSEEVDPAILSRELRATIETFPRKISLRLSDRVQVPAAIGFFQPAVVIPRWFLEESTPQELEPVLQHELTHLRRRDDWTNLAQKIIKALLFFHPSVCWVEQQLSLEREMACDDAVLAQAASPRDYAQCLTRLAEKTLRRKKMALVQAMLSRVRQLSLRVAQILDVNRPAGTRLWKPAVPMVAAAAALCGLSAWSAPELISFQANARTAVVSQSQGLATASRESGAQPKVVLASATMNQPKSKFNSKANARSLQPLRQRRTGSRDDARVLTHAQLPTTARGDYVVQAEQVIVTMSSDGQVRMWEVRILVPVTKTAPKKNI